jgi:hypothetical protein
MSFTFDYTSVEPVPDRVATQISIEAANIRRSIDWWAEPLLIEQEQDSKRLSGSSRVSLGDGYGSVRVSEAEDSLLMCRDMREIVKALVRWSQNYKITWQLEMAGVDIGRIKPGKEDPVAGRFLGSCDQPGLLERNIPQILKKHEMRKR